MELINGMVARRRQVIPGRSYLSQVELPLTFGFGYPDRVDRLLIRWPTERLRIVAADRLLQVEQPPSVNH